MQKILLLLSVVMYYFNIQSKENEPFVSFHYIQFDTAPILQHPHHFLSTDNLYDYIAQVCNLYASFSPIFTHKREGTRLSPSPRQIAIALLSKRSRQGFLNTQETSLLFTTLTSFKFSQKVQNEILPFLKMKKPANHDRLLTHIQEWSLSS